MQLLEQSCFQAAKLSIIERMQGDPLTNVCIRSNSSQRVWISVLSLLDSYFDYIAVRQINYILVNRHEVVISFS